MKKWITVLFVALSLLAVRTYAQETGAGPGTLEVTLIPGGGMFFVGSNNESSFGNYNLGGALTYNINRYVGIEGEVDGALGLTQNLLVTGISSNQKTPNTFNYTGNAVLSTPAYHGTVVYATGGAGGLTMFQNTGLGITNNATFLTGNVGGGVKWFANDRIGFRADYRFVMVKSSDNAPTFFGQDNRYGHRVYGALVLNVLR